MEMARPIIKTTRIGDRIEAVYVVFRPGIHARETIPFSRVDGAELLVDVDEKDVPIALELLDSWEASPCPDISEAEAMSAIAKLFAFANQMVAYHRANLQARGNALIQEALESLQHLPTSA